MAYAYTVYSAGSSQTDYTIAWPYIKEAHVKVYVNFVDTSFTFHNSTTARLASAPASGTRVEVRRVTPPSAVLVDYADGSTLTASDLDTSNLQHLYIAQELDDNQKKGISISATTGLPTLGSKRLTEVADPTAAQDAATKNYVDTTAQPVDAELTELATMSSGTASSLADLTGTEVQIIDGATVTTTELNLLDGVTATTAEINYVDGVTSNVQTQLDAKQPLDAELTELATMSSDTAAALADLTQAEVQILDGATLSTAELNFVDGVTSALQTQLDAKQPLDADLTNLASCQSGASANIALLTSGEVAILDGATLSTAELNTLAGLTSSTGELNKLDGVTATTANLNVVSGMTKATSLTSNSDTELPTSKAVADHVNSVVNAVGGFVAINGPTNFPATQPAQGVVVSIKDVGSGFTTSSNEITITNGAGTNKNVRITGFPSEYAAATLVDDTGLQVTSDITNSTSGTPAVHRYVYHKQLAKESDVKALSDDINDFNERYRSGGTNPTSDNDAGDLFFNTGTDKMYVRNAANNAWDEVVSVGEFFINTLASLGSGSDSPPGGSATFNGAARKFTLSNPPSVAQQLIVSINGVIQKPNSGTGFPSEGFSLNGSALQLAAAPATGAPFFIITIGSTVNIGTPSANTVDLAKLSTSNTGSTGQFLKKDGSTEGIGWATVENDKITEGNTTVEVVDTQGNNTYGVIKGSIGYTDGSGNKTTLTDALHYTKSGNDFLFQLNQAHDGNNNDIQINVGNTSGEGGLIVEKGTGSGGVDTGRFRYSAIHNSGSWSLKTGGNTNFATSTTQFIPHQNVVPNADSTIDIGLTGTRFRNAYVDTYYGDGSNLTGISTALDSPAITGSLVITAPGTVTHTISNYSPSCQYTITPTGCTVGSVNSSGEFVVTQTGSSVSYTIKATTDSLNLDDSTVVTKTFTAVNLSAPTINSPADPNINTNCVYTITSTTTHDDKLILDFGASTFNYGSVSHGSGSKVGNTVEVTGFGTNNPAVTVQFTTAATYSVKAKAQDTGGTYGDSAYSTTDSITAVNPPYSVNYLVLAGGGGGGGSCCGDGSGGGGGGGFRASWNNEGSGGGASSESALTLQPGTVYTITVGDGGPGGDAGGGDGDDSSIVGSDITDVVSIGGGAGATRSDSVDRSAKDGGSGGGGAYGHTNANIAGSGTSGQGHDGGTFSGNPYHPAGAGGGAGAGPSGSDNEHAGAPKASTIRGTSANYGEGGRGGSSTISTNVVAGGANTGDGGDGGYAGNGAAGGSGIVVLRMATSSYSGTQSGGTVTTSGSDTIISYTTVASNHTYTA